MGKRGRRPHDRVRHKPRRQVRPARRRGPADLLSAVARRLASGDPMEFLAYASTLLAAVDPRGQNPLEPEPADGPDHVTLPTLVESFT